MFIRMFLDDGSHIVIKKEDITRLIVEFDEDGENPECTILYAPRGEEPMMVKVTNDYFGLLKSLGV